MTMQHSEGKLTSVISRFFAFLALVALLVAPVNAFAAQSACHDMAQAMPAMSGMAPAADSTSPALDPCCDPGRAAPHDSKPCMSDCIAMSEAPPILAAALSPPHPVAWVHRFAWVGLETPPRSHDPPSIKRPPRFLA
jgi:hypothetical protein